MTEAEQHVFRGALYHCLSADRDELIPDAALVVDAAGCITACGDWERMDLPPDAPVTVLPPDRILLPGLIDLHVHLPQLNAVGAQSDNLMDWLNETIFPEEARFADPDYARTVSQRFFRQLLANGTTTAAVFLTSHTGAAEIAFEAAEATGNRVIMGLNLMDENAPADLARPAPELLADAEAMCRKWHGKANGRIRYAWMPRFALSCSEELLSGIGRLRKQYPEVWFHTHLAEQIGEIRAVLEKFPQADSYTAVYDHFDLLGPRSILAHAIHLSGAEQARIEETDSGLAHCPGSNFFLKSGRFPLKAILEKNIRTGLGSDVGAGPNLSILQAMKDAQYMQPDFLVPVRTLFYLATLGAARALCLETELGSFAPGKQADFIVARINGTGAGTEAGAGIGQNWQKALSQLVYTGDERNIAAVYVAGQEICFKNESHL